MGREAINLVGRTFGRLIVIEKIDVPGSRNARWLCVCRCQRVVKVYSCALRRGTTTSCGCGRIDRCREMQARTALKSIQTRSDEDMAVRRTHYEYRSAAKKHGVVFDLTLETFGEIIRSVCHYCGMPPFAGFAPRSPHRKRIPLNGVDRLDPVLGYIQGNVVPCCKHCNKAKLDRTPEAFVEHCRRVVAYQVQVGRV